VPVTEPLLVTAGVSLQIDGQTLLQGIDLRAEAGRTLVILGPNGAGKSLLLRVLHGLIAPNAGDIKVHGKLLDRQARDRQAMVFQRPIMLRRSVRQNLMFAMRARRIPRQRQQQRVDELLHLARLQTKSDQPARSLSGGEQQRLALTRALIADPELLFLDEPTASLDPASTAAIETVLRESIARGTTPILVTHDVLQARRLAHDVVFLYEGRIAEYGPAERLLNHPDSTAMQDWIAGRLPATNHL
jgi:tungstate transport system ATP-binding protein